MLHMSKATYDKYFQPPELEELNRKELVLHLEQKRTEIRWNKKQSIAHRVSF